MFTLNSKYLGNEWLIHHDLSCPPPDIVENGKREQKQEFEGGNKAPYREIIEDLTTSNGHFLTSCF